MTSSTDLPWFSARFPRIEKIANPANRQVTASTTAITNTSLQGEHR